MAIAVSRPAASLASALPVSDSLVTSVTSTARAIIGRATISKKKRVRRRRKLNGDSLDTRAREARLGAVRAAILPRAIALVGDVPGAIAQLGERLVRNQEVAGSSPASSISRERAHSDTGPPAPEDWRLR